MRNCLLIGSLFFGLHGQDGMYRSKHRHDVTLVYERDLERLTSRSYATVNGKSITCFCGGDPIIVFMVYGHVQAFCIHHVPTIDIDNGRNCKCAGA